MVQQSCMADNHIMRQQTKHSTAFKQEAITASPETCVLNGTAFA